MICHKFKGGTGSSSRVVPGAEGTDYTVAALVQANYGQMRDLKISGAPIGRLFVEEQERKAEEGSGDPRTPLVQTEASHQTARPDHDDETKGSIIVVIATNAPLHPTQLQRIAKRATVGLARVGGWGGYLSGDMFLAFSTANELHTKPESDKGGKVDPFAPRTLTIHMVDDRTINALFEASADAVEEAILNALCKAETMIGNGATVEALDLGKVQKLMAKYL